jgi:hypothetical protein
MPPRRSARVAAVAEREQSALAQLPHALLLLCFSALPVDSRLLAAAVCRGWRAVLSERSVWRRLDLSPAGGIAREGSTVGLLRVAAGRASGELQALDVSGCGNAVTYEALLAVVGANAGALRELRVCDGWCGVDPGIHLNEAQLETLLHAAPQLHAFDVDVSRDGDVARRMLRNEGVFRPLRVHEIFVQANFGFAGDVPALAADLAAHPSLTVVALGHTRLDSPAALNAVVDAVLTLGLSGLLLFDCGLSPASAPALARLLTHGTHLRRLCINGLGNTIFDAPSAEMVGSAVRANATLRDLSFINVGLWRDEAAATAVLGSITAHPHLRQVSLSANIPANREQASAAVASLLTANSPALQRLDVASCGLGDAGIGALLDAMASNTHLRTLEVADGDMSNAFRNNRLLPVTAARGVEVVWEM